MAWKKYAEHGQDVYFRNGTKVIGINPVKKGSVVWERFLMGWAMTTNYWYGAPPEKYFKTKSAALKWAKSWMRKDEKKEERSRLSRRGSEIGPTGFPRRFEV